VKEASYANIPVIAFCDADSPVKFVDCAIPCNNRSKHSLALMYWLLAREVNRMRDTISRHEPWGVVVDLFMYREPEEEDEKKGAIEEAPAVEEEVKEVVEPAAAEEKKVEAGFTTEFAEMKADNSAFDAAPKQDAAWGAQQAGQDASWGAAGQEAGATGGSWGDSTQ